MVSGQFDRRAILWQWPASAAPAIVATMRSAPSVASLVEDVILAPKVWETQLCHCLAANGSPLKTNARIKTATN